MSKSIEDFNIKFPIIAGTEIAGIQLRSHIKDFHSLIYAAPVFSEDKDMERYVVLYNSNQFVYEIKDTIRLFFNIFNGKLYKISALKNYKGFLENSIYVGMPIDKALIEKSDLIYDDLEELYYSNGVTVETDAYGKYIEVITVYIAELDSLFNDHAYIEDIERGSW